MTKAEMEAFKKKNFNMKVKVTEAQLNKLRKEGTPTKAIAKYKSDPAMREALNRFYGKDRVNKAIGSGLSTKQPAGPGSTMKPRPPKGSGPGNTRPKTRPGGPGAKTGADGRMSTRTKKSSGPSVGKQVGAAVGAAAVGAASVKAITSAGNKKVGRYAAPGKTVKTPVTRSAPGKYAAPKSSTASKVGKAADQMLKGPAGVVGKYTKAASKTAVGKNVTKVVSNASKTPAGKVAGKVGKVGKKVVGGKVGLAITAAALAAEAINNKKKK